MTFLEAMQAAREGKKVRLPNWKHGRFVFWLPDIPYYYQIGNRKLWSLFVPSVGLIFADWQIVEEK